MSTKFLSEEFQELFIHFKRRIRHNLGSNYTCSYTAQEKSLAVFFTENGMPVRYVAEETGISKASISLWRTLSKDGNLPKYIPPPKKLAIVENLSENSSAIMEHISSVKTSPSDLACELVFPSGITMKVNCEMLNIDFICMLEKGVQNAHAHH